MTAELLVKVEHDPSPEGHDQNDIICARNTRSIRRVHCQIQCHHWHQGSPNNHGYYDLGDHREAYHRIMRPYKCEVLDKHTLRQTNQITGVVEELTDARWEVTIEGHAPLLVEGRQAAKVRRSLRPSRQLDFDQQKPLWKCASDSSICVMFAAVQSLGVSYADITFAFSNSGGDVLIVDGAVVNYTKQLLNEKPIDLPLYMSRRRKHKNRYNGGPKAAIFGTIGREVWYAGQADIASMSKVNQAWGQVETFTPKRRNAAEFELFPTGQNSLKHQIALPVEDFDDDVAADLVAPEYIDDDETRPRTQIRKHRVNWRQQLSRFGLNESHVRDKSRKIDIRRHAEKVKRSNHVGRKPRKSKGIPSEVEAEKRRKQFESQVRIRNGSR